MRAIIQIMQPEQIVRRELANDGIAGTPCILLFNEDGDGMVALGSTTLVVLAP